MHTISELAEIDASPTEIPRLRTNHRASTVTSYYDAVKQVILAMYKQFDEPLSLPEMAAVAALSPHHFNRIFRQITGITPGHFLCAIRLKAALQLLLTTQLSVTDVCFAVGYNSLGTFTTRFTQLIGLPPTQLRDFVEKAPSMLELLAGYRNSSALAEVAGARVRGQVVASDPAIACVFVGLFPTAVPQGCPVSCALLATPGSFQIPAAPDGRYYVLVAAFPKSDNPLSFLLPDYTSLKVGAGQRPLTICRGYADGHPEIQLRGVSVTDPPILSPLSLLVRLERTMTG
jgi:AraC family transcriptional regulator